MNNALVLIYSPFVKESIIRICEDGNFTEVVESSEVEGLANRLIAMAYQYNIYTVKVHGSFAISKQLNKLINEYEQKQYSVNKIKVEDF